MIQEIYEKAIRKWRTNKGVGTFIIPAPFNSKLFILSILQRMYAANLDNKIILLVPNFKDRIELIEYFTNQENQEENNEEFKKLINNGNLKIVTVDFAKKELLDVSVTACICHKVDKLKDVEVIITNSVFKLIVFTKTISNKDIVDVINKTAPILSAFTQREVEEVRLSLPVEEVRIGVDIPESSDDFKLLSYYTEYITSSISIFGSFEVLNQATKGNAAFNISANEICYKIAKENGWDEHLDMSIPFNVEIDKLYNPMSLKDRAAKTYEIVRLRNNFLSDYEAKLTQIVNIVRDNADKKILIISKRADFASVVTAYVNKHIGCDVCMNYHDKLDSIPAVDIHGNNIYYKSGINKNKIKTMGFTAQKSLAVQKFNANKINVLSANNAPDKDLEIDVDILILTSSLCEDISSYIYRLSKVTFRNGMLQVYTLYCRNTSEEKSLENKPMAKNHSIKNVANESENVDFIVVD